MGEEMTAVVIECTICYHKHHHDDFHVLECCRGKQICRECLACLTVPLCPYCRERIPGVQGTRLASSYVDLRRSPILRLQAHFLADEGLLPDDDSDLLDPRLLDSRILRRRMRRLRKLQLRDEDRLRNRLRTTITTPSSL